MDEQRYWRNIIAREIKAEHDRVKKFYSKRGANAGGISPEEQTRLNIFALCQSIVETYNTDIPAVSAQPPKERKPRATSQAVDKPIAEPIVEPVAQAVVEPVEKPAAKPVTKSSTKPRTQKKTVPQPLTQPQQNEFGEFI